MTENTQGAGASLEPVAGKRENFPAYDAEIQLAQLIAKSTIMPKHLQQNPGNCLAVIMLSRDWNMNPIMVGLKTSVIKNKHGHENLMFEGQLVNAAVNNSKKLNGRLKFKLSGQGDKTVCEVTGHIRGEAEPETIAVPMPKTQNSPLWHGSQADKEQQLTYLAARVWCRRHLPEILLGVYTPEDDWTEGGMDEKSDRHASVQGQLSVLEHQPAATLAPVADEFVAPTKEAVTVGVDLGRPGGDKTAKVTVQRQGENLKVLDVEVEEPAGRAITDNPEDRTDPLDEPIPDFNIK